MKRIRVIHHGLGSIGIEAARLVLKKDGLEIAGAIDIAEDKVGKDLGEVLGVNKRLGIPVSDDPDSLFLRVDADVVLHTTGSRLRDIYPEIVKAVSAGMNLISSAEELVFPSLQNPKLASDLDDLAKKNEVTIVGTGVNPGFAMDVLPLVFTGVCQEVRRIEVKRVVDASTRRLPLQRKIGAGLTTQEFRKGVEQGTLGHVGLIQSLALIAHSLGWELDQIKQAVDPVIAETDLQTQYVKVEKGQVSGIKHIARGIKDGREVISLDLEMHVGAKYPHDSILIQGKPNLNIRINGGIAGDSATVASLVNSIPRVIEAKPGLVTIKELPMPYAVL